MRPIASVQSWLGQLGQVRTFLAVFPDIMAFVAALKAGDRAAATTAATKVLTAFGLGAAAGTIAQFATSLSAMIALVRSWLPATPAPTTGPIILPLTASHAGQLETHVMFLESSFKTRAANNKNDPLTSEELVSAMHLVDALVSSL
jgi:hypothetical protein